MEIADELVLSTAYPNGTNSWTLATRLSQVLTEVEAQYGERDRTFTFVGVEFFKGVPHIWFPGGGKHVIVRLWDDCLKYPIKAYWQLAHEAVHLLNPVLVGNNLEEGVATYFAVEYVKRHFGGQDFTAYTAGTPYDDALKAVKVVAALCPDFVRSLRDQGGGTWKALSAVTEQDILRVCPACPVATARFLAAPFGQQP